VKAGKSEQFDALKGSLPGEDESPRKEIAERLGMSEGAVKVGGHLGRAALNFSVTSRLFSFRK